MSPSSGFAHTEGYRAQEFRCPLLHPRPTGQPCAQEQFAKGPGCVTQITSERGGLLRALWDRDSPAYKDIYHQRTCAERSQAPARGIERPKGRNARAVQTLNPLTSIVINAQALARVRLAQARAPTHVLC